jgi:hypothetical protein
VLTEYRSILLCALYYYFWAILLPTWKNYTIRQEFVTLEGGAQALQLRKVPNAELAAWDASHDAAGHLISRNLSDSDNEKEEALSQDIQDGNKRVNVVVRDDERV